MKVLADLHHHSLFESLQLLFVDRFGWELRAPIGMEWYDAGYWNFERALYGDAIARQYLVGYWPLAVEGTDRWLQPDHRHPGRMLQAVTLEQARDWKPDLVVITLAHNYEGLTRFAREVGAKVVFQLGNIVMVANDPFQWADAALLSTTYPVPVPIPHVTYHQEFSLDHFRYSYPPATNEVASFVQCFAEDAEYKLFKEYAALVPELSWRVYGNYGSAPADEFKAGHLETVDEIAKRMRGSRVAWHAKHWSDGYGHVIHNWFAVGRPVIGYSRWYESQLAGPLWMDGVTSFDLERRSRDEVVALLRRLATDDGYHHRISASANARFRELVNFEAEAEQIRAMLDNVLSDRRVLV